MMASDRGARSRRPRFGREEPPAVAPGHRVHRRGAGEVGEPGDEEDAERSGQTPIGEEGTQRHSSIRGHRRDHVLDRGKQGENGVDGDGRKLRHPPEQGLDQRASSVATAMTAMPSPRPMNPIPSLVLALRLTEPGLAPNRSARVAAICCEVGAQPGLFGDDGQVGLLAGYNPRDLTSS